MVCGESRKVGYEEEIEEQFNAVGFVSLREDEGVVICAYQWGFDPWCGLMQTLEMLLFVAVGELVTRGFGSGRSVRLELRTHRAGKC